MEQLNRVELRGRIGNVRISNVSGRSVCHFSVATNSIYRNSENAVVEETTWHNCSIWSSQRLPDLSFIKVGMPVTVVGRLRNSKYTGADGVERWSTEVMASDVKALPENEPLRSAQSC